MSVGPKTATDARRWALGVGVGRSPLRNFQMMAGQLFARALPALNEFSSPRAWAFRVAGHP